MDFYGDALMYFHSGVDILAVGRKKAQAKLVIVGFDRSGQSCSPHPQSALLRLPVS
jgi:hypothetical protein